MLLDRYILRLWLGPFLGGLTTVLGALMLSRALKFLDQIGDAPAAGAIIAEMLFSVLPYFLLLTVPMAFFLSMQYVIVSLQQNSEMDALRAAGLSYWRIFRSLFAVMCVLLPALIWTAMYWMPDSQLRLLHLLVRAQSLGNAALGLAPQRFTHSDEGITIYVEGELEDHRYRGVLIEDARSDPPVQYLARQGEFLHQGQQLMILLTQGVRLEGQGQAQRIVRFDEYRITMPLHALRLPPGFGADRPASMRGEKLWTFIHEHPGPAAIAEWHRRLSLPCLLVALFLFALPLSLTPKRSGKAGSLLLGIALLIALYNLQLAQLKAIELHGATPVWLWLTQALQLGLGVMAWRRAEQGRLPRLLSQSGELMYLLHQWIQARIGQRREL